MYNPPLDTATAGVCVCVSWKIEWRSNTIDKRQGERERETTTTGGRRTLQTSNAFNIILFLLSYLLSFVAIFHFMWKRILDGAPTLSANGCILSTKKKSPEKKWDRRQKVPREKKVFLTPRCRHPHSSSSDMQHLCVRCRAFVCGL